MTISGICLYFPSGGAMLLGKVTGNLVCTVKHDAYRGTKLLLVQPLGLDLKPQGDAVVAVDTVGAGPGELVLLVREGAAARQVLKVEHAPVRSLVIGIVDYADIRG